MTPMMDIERLAKRGLSEGEGEDDRGERGRENEEERRDTQRGSSGHANAMAAGTEGRLRASGRRGAAWVATNSAVTVGRLPRGRKRQKQGHRSIGLLRRHTATL